MQRERDHDADGHAAADLAHRAGEDADEQASRPRAEGCADADLAAPLGDRERHQRVQSGR
jgi:hypothetical protein